MASAPRPGKGCFCCRGSLTTVWFRLVGERRTGLKTQFDATVESCPLRGTGEAGTRQVCLCSITEAKGASRAVLCRRNSGGGAERALFDPPSDDNWLTELKFTSYQDSRPRGSNPIPTPTSTHTPEAKRKLPQIALKCGFGHVARAFPLWSLWVGLAGPTAQTREAPRGVLSFVWSLPWQRSIFGGDVRHAFPCGIFLSIDRPPA